MTNEAILGQFRDRWFRDNITEPGIWLSDASKCMDAARKDEAIAFAEWKDANYIKSARKDRIDKFYHKSRKTNNGLLEYFSYQELYQLFKQQP